MCYQCKKINDELMAKEDAKAEIEFEISKERFLNGQVLMEEKVKQVLMEEKVKFNMSEYLKKLNKFHNERLKNLNNHYN